MTSSLKRLAAATAISLSFMGPSFAMQSEVDMLTGTIFNMLTAMNMETASMTNLTLGEINAISSIVHGGDTEAEKQAKIGAILRRASER